jgi:hypothetical protein
MRAPGGADAKIWDADVFPAAGVIEALAFAAASPIRLAATRCCDFIITAAGIRMYAFCRTDTTNGTAACEEKPLATIAPPPITLGHCIPLTSDSEMIARIVSPLAGNRRWIYRDISGTKLEG